MWRIFRLLLPLGVLAMALAAYAGRNTPPPADSVLTSGPPKAEHILVVARNNRFEPSAIRVRRGASIHFVIKNLDSEEHDYALVPEGPLPCWLATRPLVAGATEEIDWEVPGFVYNWRLICLKHPMEVYIELH